MQRPILLIVLLATLTAAGAGAAACSGAGDATSPAPSSPGSPAATDTPAADPASGSKMAPGLYDLADGTVVAVGTVEFRDLEGGFWAVVGEAEAEGNAGEVVAVLANGEEFAEQFRGSPGLSFEIRGERAGEVSVRMAGPEIKATSVTLAGEGGPAE
jgi:hypothetical protein